MVDAADPILSYLCSVAVIHERAVKANASPFIKGLFPEFKPALNMLLGRRRVSANAPPEDLSWSI